MTIEVTFTESVKEMQTENGKDCSVTTYKATLTNEASDDTYTIGRETYDRLKSEGKTDLQIFEYIDTVMRT